MNYRCPPNRKRQKDDIQILSSENKLLLQKIKKSKSNNYINKHNIPLTKKNDYKSSINKYKNKISKFNVFK